jgi:purine-binding chemotaxis protein CheW
VVNHDHVLVFTIDERRFAVDLACVTRIVRAVEINPVPKAPDSVLGIINMRGRIVPVLNLRRFFCRPERDLDLDDRLIILQAKARLVAFPADDVNGVLECPERSMTAGGAVLPEVTSLEGVMVLKDGMVLIYDLDRFLSSEEVGAFPQHLSPEGGPAVAPEVREGPHD